MTTAQVEGFRLSPQQRRLWRGLTGAVPAARAARLEVAIEGSLHGAALRAAVERVVERHEALRTRFEPVPGLALPVQVVGEARVEWSEGAPGEWAPNGAVRAALVPAGDGHRLSVTVDALCADRRSLANLLREVAVEYGRLRDQPVPGDGEPPVQYPDVAEVFHDLLESGEAPPLAHWKAAEEMEPPVLPYPRESGDRSFDPRVLEVEPEAGWGRRVTAAAAGLGCAPASFLLAAWIATLARLSGSRVGVGSLHEGRNFEGLPEAVGLFARLVPVAPAVTPATSFRELVARVVEEEGENGELQETYPGPGEGGWFPASFAPAVAPFAVEAGGARFRWVDGDGVEDRFEWQLLCPSDPEAEAPRLAWDASRHHRGHAARLLGAFHALVEGAAADLSLRLGRLPVLPGASRRRLAAAWTGTATTTAGVVERFAGQVARTPDAVAVRHPGGEVCYADLAAQAGRLTAALRQRRLGAETVVGVAVERRPELVVAILGVLSSGAAFLPLDPDGPAERTAWMVEDAGARLLLTAGDAPALVDCDLPRLDLSADLPPEGPGEPVVPHPRQLAYVLYTSGSSGRPKGVEVEHGPLARYLAWVDGTLPQGEGLPLITRPTFDAVLKQLLAPLLRGATVIVPPAAAVDDPGAMRSFLDAHPGLVVNCVPAYWRAVLGDGGTVPPVGGLLVGGESTPADLLEATWRGAPRLQAWNLYGPTEATANAAAGRLEPGGGPILDRPVAGAAIHLLDGRLEPVAEGEEGEICIGGDGLARGYRGRPALTADAFRPDPAATEAGGRLYRTGDRARLDLEDRLEFRGRRDDQVKLRGVRIELGDVEGALRRLPGVADAAAAVQGAGEAATLLVGYLVPEEGVEPDVVAARDRLVTELPEPMIPSRLVVLDQLPRLSSGKLDRARLPQPPAPGEGGSEAPRTAVEAALAALWSELLEAETVGREDRFHALGGHSLLAVQLVSRLQRTFGVELSLREVLDARDLADLAARVEEARQRESSVPPLVPRQEGDPAPLAFNQERLYFLSLLEPDSPVYHIPASAHLRGPLSVSHLARAFADLCVRHEVLRSNFRDVRGLPEVVVRPSGEVSPLPVIDLSALPAPHDGRETERLLREEVRRPFDLARDPLLRHSLVRRAAEDWTLLATCHHIVSDGWSNRVLLDDLAELYQAHREGRPSRLPRLPIQYADYALWQRRWLQGDELNRRQDFWRHHLAGLEPTTLPGDRARPAVRSSSGGRSHPWRLPSELHRALRRLGRECEATSFNVMLAVLATTLHRWTGRDDVALGVHTVNRHRPETERAIGLFANQVVLRLDLSGDPSFRRLLRRVQETVLAAFDHQEVPFNLVLEAVRPSRDAGRNPLFQMMFPYQNLPPLPDRFADLEMSPVQVGTGTAPFDLSFHTHDHGDRIEGFFRYDGDLFDEATMVRLESSLLAILAAALESPETTVGQLADHGRAAERRREESAAAELEQVAARSLRRRRGTGRAGTPKSRSHRSPEGDLP